jgi:hypothetical protein
MMHASVVTMMHASVVMRTRSDSEIRSLKSSPALRAGLKARDGFENDCNLRSKDPGALAFRFAGG